MSKQTKKNPMKFNHRLRKVVESLNTKLLKQGDLNLLSHANELLRKEEIHGAGFWGDVGSFLLNVVTLPTQLLNEVPMLNSALHIMLPAEAGPILDVIKQAKYVLPKDTNQYLTKALGSSNMDKSYTTDDTIGPGGVQSGKLTVGGIRAFFDAGGTESDLSVINKTNTSGGYYTGPPISTLKRDANGKLISQPSVTTGVTATTQAQLGGQPLHQQLTNNYVNALSDTLENLDVRTQVSNPYGNAFAIPGYNGLMFAAYKGDAMPVAMRFPVFLHDARDNAKGLKHFRDVMEAQTYGTVKHEWDEVVEEQKPYRWLQFPQYSA